jgi:hypothetical protein
MDPHFHEYLAAIAGMQEVYGDRLDCHPTEFHDEPDAAAIEASAATVAAA